MVKAFNVPFEYVLHEMSYPNVILYSATLPTYDSHADRPGQGLSRASERVLNITDPKAQADIDKFIDGFD